MEGALSELPFINNILQSRNQWSCSDCPPPTLNVVTISTQEDLWGQSDWRQPCLPCGQHTTSSRRSPNPGYPPSLLSPHKVSVSRGHCHGEQRLTLPPGSHLTLTQKSDPGMARGGPAPVVPCLSDKRGLFQSPFGSIGSLQHKTHRFLGASLAREAPGPGWLPRVSSSSACPPQGQVLARQATFPQRERGPDGAGAHLTFGFCLAPAPGSSPLSF